MSNSPHIDPQPVDQTAAIITALTPVLYTIGIGAFTTAIYFVFRQVLEYVTKTLTASVTVENQDPIFNYLLSYLSESGYMKKSMSSVTASLQKENKKKWWDDSADSTDDYKQNIDYKPSSGSHKFEFEGHLIYVNHTYGETMTVGWERQPQRQESLVLWTKGRSNIAVLQKILQLSFGHASKKDQGKQKIYSQHSWSNAWEQTQTKNPRAIESVILDKDLSDNIKGDVSNFLSSQQWYMDRGIPYRRGYLLYGPPGTGKTSFVLAIAGALNLNICSVNLSGNRLDDDGVNALLESTPKRSIILLEDIDAIFVDRNSVKSSNDGRQVSFSGLLNALDGVRSQEGRILFMTTNHKEKLDPALLRPGRADVHVKLANASEIQAKRMFLKFFPGEEKLAKEFSERIPENKISMAKLQGHFLQHKQKPEQCINHVKDLVDQDQIYNEEMGVTEWLFRFGLEEFAHNFIQKGITKIHHLKSISESDLEQYGIDLVADQQNVMSIINGEKEYQHKFQYMTRNKIRGYMSITPYSDKFQEKVTELMPSQFVTEFQLRKIMDQQLSEEEVTKKLEDLTKKIYKFNNDESYRKVLDQKYEKKDYKFETTVKETLESVQCSEYLKNFEEQGIDSIEMLLDCSEDVLEGAMKVEKFGDRKRINKKIEALQKEKEDAEKELEKQFYKKLVDSVDIDEEEFNVGYLNLIKNSSVLQKR